SIVAWGYNYSGQTNVPAPNTGFVAVSGGYYHSLGLKADGSIVAWGRDIEGQTNVPAPNTGFVAVAAGDYHSLGLKADGSIVAWGYNYSGQTNVPAPNTGFVAVSGGYYHSLGLKADGSIVAWGDNDYGQTNLPAPNTGFTAVAAGFTHRLGLKGDAACCLTHGSCRQLRQSECVALGGLWHGGASKCQSDRDGDSIADLCDACPDGPAKSDPEICGCSVADTDSDGDGLGDLCDNCAVDANRDQTDDDLDGTGNACDECPGTLVGIIVAPNGCPVPLGPCCFGGEICVDATTAEDCERVHGIYLGDGFTCGSDADGDGVLDCNDRCPLDARKSAPGTCGCGFSDIDSDHDGIPDCIDPCPPLGFPDLDGDGICDLEDGCPGDPAKSEPGVCGCGVPDDDTDADGTADCIDLCSNTSPNVPVNTCGCVPLGACCFSVGVCFNSLSVDSCVSIDGIYQGDGSACTEGCGFADFDRDGAVDLRDVAVFQRCFGADETDLSDGLCKRGDIDGCQEIDLWDYDAFRRAMTGP
ncbi:MAG: thrombospondin type 3 repeat-containing protein, partial [Planctomycetota bacterium]